MTAPAPVWVATADAYRCEWVATGATREEVRAALARALLDYRERVGYYIPGEPDDPGELLDWHGARVLALQPGQVARDGTPER